MLLKIFTSGALFLVSVATSGCMPIIVGENRKIDADTERFDLGSVGSLLAEEYFVEDQDCQNSVGLGEIGSQDVHRFGGGSTYPKQHAFNGFNASSSLAGPGFSASVYNFHQQTKCERTKDGESCEQGVKIVGAAKKLKICRTSGTYARASIEGIALTSVSILDEANRFYRTVPNARSNLRDATVIVLPIVEKQIAEVESDGASTTYRSVTTDNLAYTSNFDGAPAFVIYPKSRNAVSKGRWVNLNLWELPWGMAHEFGHHVFRSHSGIEKLPGTTTSLHGLELAMPIHSFDIDDDSGRGVGLSLVSRTVGPEQIFSAVNESFADLYAYYALGKPTNMTEGVDCFEKNREITSAYYLNGTPKVLSSTVLELFLSSDKVSSNSCEGENFQDAHSVGAIIAHGMMRIFAERAKVSGASAKEQAGWLLIWAESVGTAIRTDGRSAVTLDRLIGLGIEAASESGGVLTSGQCTIVREIFPAFSAKWIGSKFAC